MQTAQNDFNKEEDRTSAVLQLREELLKKVLSTQNIRTLEKALAILSPEPGEGIPLCVFSNDVYSLNECIVKFLHENRMLSFTKIAEITAKSPKTVWQTYQNAKKKSSETILVIGEDRTYIPYSAFNDKEKSTLGIVVSYLKDEEHMEFRGIASALHRDYQTVWTTYKRGKGR